MLSYDTFATRSERRRSEAPLMNGTRDIDAVQPSAKSHANLRMAAAQQMF